MTANNISDIQNTIYETMFEQVPFGIAVSYNCYPTNEGENKEASINSTYEQITGRKKEEMLKLGWAIITHPDDLQENLDKYNELQQGIINSYSMEKRFIRPDGSIVWVDLTVAKLKLDNDSKYKHISIVQDISVRKSMENALIESERSKAVLLSNLPGMAYRCNYDRDWTMQFVSEGCYELTGYKASSLINNKDLSFNDLIAPEYQVLLWNAWKRTLSKKKPFKHEYEIMTSKGQRKWVLEMGQGIFDESGVVIALEGIIIDISDRKEQENRLKFISEHNELTGVHNRRFFESFLISESKFKRYHNRAIIYIKLKKIDSVSLIYGYNFSRRLIIELSEKLCKICNNNRKLFQISLDRFVFYIKNYDDKCDLSDFSNEIFNKFKEVQILYNLGCSIGILEIEKDNCDLESLLKSVSFAAENADNKKIFDYCFYDDKLKAKANRENNIKDELFKTITDYCSNSIFLQYQPIVNQKTGKIRGFEALARFQSEKLGLVLPSEFIQIAEEMQLIVPIGLRVIYKACEFIRKLELSGHDHIKVSVNVSVIELLNDEFVGNLKVLIEEAKIKKENFGIEITESIIMDNFEIINEKLYTLKEMGIEILIDDFGTGYSSLSRESELHVNGLKIDKYFVDKIIEQDKDKIITGDIISMAHKLGHFVVAEGVECEKQYQYLVDNSCDYIQGYYISKPLDEEDAQNLLKTEKIIERFEYEL